MTEQIEALFARRRFGITPGLVSEERLMEQMGHPERAFAALHVAGTNGKGSVCAMLASVLSAAGYRTGLFTSPHLVHLNERFWINGAMVDDAGLCELMERTEAAAEAIDAQSDHPVTFFECSAAMAFDYFRSQKVQLAVLETGMGGRLDATNVVDPAMSIITRIDLDHMAYLGNDVATIAAEKAGIIKPGRPVVLGAMPPEAREVMVRTAAERSAPVRDAAQTVGIDVLKADLDGQRVKVSTASASYAPMTLPLLGIHQVENLATVVAACEVLRDHVGLPFPEDALAAGLAATRWPARLQVLQREPPVILDGAHNPDGARALAASLQRLCKGRPVGLVLGMCADKHIRATLQELAVLNPTVWTVRLTHERGMPADELQQIAKATGLSALACDSLSGALDQAVSRAGGRDGVIGVVGSLFLAGEVLEMWKGLE